MVCPTCGRYLLSDHTTCPDCGFRKDCKERYPGDSALRCVFREGHAGKHSAPWDKDSHVEWSLEPKP